MIGGLIIMAQALASPSGTPLTLFDTRLAGGTAHLRFVAPQPLDFDVVELDFLWACETLKDTVPGAREVVVVIADQKVEFGVFDPDVTQFFELFDVGPEGCEWRGF